MMTRTIVLVGALGLVGCVGEVTDESGEATVELEAWSPNYVAGVATLGAQSVRFESVADGGDALLVTFDFGDLYVEYGAIAADDVFWLDGYGGALSAAHIALLKQLAPALRAEMSDDPAQRSAAEHMLAGATAHLKDGSIDFAVNRKTWRLGLTDPADEGIIYGYGNDGVTCIKPGRTYRVKFDWPDYSFSRDKTVSTDGAHCSRLGYCGDCLFTTGTYALDCFEHDWCLHKAHDMGLPAQDANPYDYYCGDEWQEAADDFLLGYNWPYYCRG